MIEATPLERVVHFAGAVGRDNDDRRMRRFHGAKLRHGDLEIGEHFQKKCLESFIGTIDLVDQQDRRSRGIGLEGLQERSFDQKAIGEHVVFDPRAITLAFSFRETNGDHLGAVVPLVNRRGNVEALVALQPDQTASKRRGQHFRNFGLADPRLTLDKHRPAHAQCKVKHRRQRTVGDVVGLGQQIEGGIDRIRKGLVGHAGILSYHARVYSI